MNQDQIVIVYLHDTHHWDVAAGNQLAGEIKLLAIYTEKGQFDHEVLWQTYKENFGDKAAISNGSLKFLDKDQMLSFAGHAIKHADSKQFLLVDPTVLNKCLEESGKLSHFWNKVTQYAESVRLSNGSKGIWNRIFESS